MFPDSPECLAVNGTNTVGVDGEAMLPGGIAFIVFKVVDRELFVEIPHNAVSFDLGKDAGGSNGSTLRFSFGQRFLRYLEGNSEFAIYEDEIRNRAGNVFDCQFHRKQ
jgi:hypothetical protein